MKKALKLIGLLWSFICQKLQHLEGSLCQAAHMSSWIRAEVLQNLSQFGFEQKPS
jgi:hypothetical protein